MSFLPARGWSCLMDSKRRSSRAPDSSQAPCASQLVLTVQNAEPQDALAVKGARIAPKSNIRLTLSPVVVAGSHNGRQRRRAGAMDDDCGAAMRMLDGERDAIGGNSG